MYICIYVHRMMSDIDKCYGEKQRRGRGQREVRGVILEQLKKDSLRRRHLSRDMNEARD